MALIPPNRRRDAVIRQPRLRELVPTSGEPPPLRSPSRLSASPYMLLVGFILLILAGGLLLALPIASNSSEFSPFEVSFFTAVSALTVTGHTVVTTSTYWSGFG